MGRRCPLPTWAFDGLVGAALVVDAAVRVATLPLRLTVHTLRYLFFVD